LKVLFCLAIVVLGLKLFAVMNINKNSVFVEKKNYFVYLTIKF